MKKLIPKLVFFIVGFSKSNSGITITRGRITDENSIKQNES